MKNKSHTLPKSVLKYFWGDDLKDLSWAKHQDYITQTILEKGDSQAVKWLMQTIDKERLKSTLPHLKLDPKSKNFWSFYLA